VAEDQGIIVLSRLIADRCHVTAARRIELVLTNIGYPSGKTEKESLNGNDINCIDRAVAINITCRQPATSEKCNIEEMPLDRDHIHGADAGGTWRPGGFAGGNGVVPASHQS